MTPRDPQGMTSRTRMGHGPLETQEYYACACRYIEGFISKQEAETKLMQASEPMMLIRFSDNQLAGLSIVYKGKIRRQG